MKVLILLALFALLATTYATVITAPASYSYSGGYALPYNYGYYGLGLGLNSGYYGLNSGAVSYTHPVYSSSYVVPSVRYTAPVSYGSYSYGYPVGGLLYKK
ncbi:shematrin-like protein 1 [Oppia nitens]|uniref:shematrin-like protein 1 n=1 Tax=Oppia nitens TaxID=1686743 RepID=UPI0023DA3B82|nr:shematrin-like protein 1 [Oppia nitens]